MTRSAFCLACACPMILALLAGCEIRTVESEPESPAVEQPTRPAENSSHAAAAQRIQFVEGYARGYERALDEGKPMLVFFTATWCDYCHQMAEQVFRQSAVVNLSRRFVCVKVDADLERQVCQQFHVKGYPTIQFISPRGVPLNRLTGKQPAHRLLVQMQAALQAVARRGDGPIPR